VSGPVPVDVEAYVEAVLQTVEQVPAGRVVTYGDVAAAVGRGGPRQVGAVMSRFGATVSWWRVVRADGQPARGHEEQALSMLRAEGTPLIGSRVALSVARCPLVADAASSVLDAPGPG
jgi:methylated-DNA-protein-cysteine methyltransferase-like protein